MTSGDIARMLDVDLKTIHNWVRHGHLHGRRTKGRHLRFHRTEVVRFMRRFGYQIPESIGQAVPRVVLVGLPAGNERAVRTLGDSVALESYSCLFDASLVVAAGEFEVLVVDLDQFPSDQVAELITALRRRAVTQGIAVVGVSTVADRREEFVGAGGDIAVSASTDLRATVRWLTGAAPTPTEQSQPAPLLEAEFPLAAAH